MTLIQRRTLASKQCFKLRPNNHGYTNWWLEYVFGISANNNSDYKRTINDLATFRVYTTVDIPIDTDGDGIQDQDDAFLDPAVAFELFTPVNMVRVLLLLRIYGLHMAIMILMMLL
jgi:hypothetical protein